MFTKSPKSVPADGATKKETINRPGSIGWLFLFVCSRNCVHFLQTNIFHLLFLSDKNSVLYLCVAHCVGLDLFDFSDRKVE